MSEPNELLNNLDKLHTTEMGVDRIKRNLSLDTDDVVGWCREKINSHNSVITRKGKNWYVHINACIITVNAYSYTIITAHKEKIYKVDYRGQMNLFDGAKESYAEGTEVEISYSLIATDTNYTFYVDGQEACVEWNGKKGYIIRFTMPAHDIEVYCVEKNLMKYET